MSENKRTVSMALSSVEAALPVELKGNSTGSWKSLRDSHSFHRANSLESF